MADAESVYGWQVVAVALGAYLVSKGASPLQRAWVAPPLVFSLGFIDSSIQGLCTESWVSPQYTITHDV